MAYDLNSLMQVFPQGMGFILIILVLVLILTYVYLTLALMFTSRKVKVPKNWEGLSWIPPAIPYLMSQMSRMHWWPAVVLPIAIIVVGIVQAITTSLFGFTNVFPKIMYVISGAISCLFFIFMIIWLWKICEFRRKPGWWSIISLVLIFIAGLFAYLTIPIVSGILGILAILWWFIMWGILAWGE